MIEHQHVFTLPSGTELDIASALGDLSRARSFLQALRDDPDNWDDQEADGLICDLAHVDELLGLLGRDAQLPVRQAPRIRVGRLAPQVVVTLDLEHRDVGSVSGPFDDDEAGAVAAAAIDHGADPRAVRVAPLRRVRSNSTFTVIRRDQLPRRKRRTRETPREIKQREEREAYATELLRQIAIALSREGESIEFDGVDELVVERWDDWHRIRVELGGRLAEPYL